MSRFDCRRLRALVYLHNYTSTNSLICKLHMPRLCFQYTVCLRSCHVLISFTCLISLLSVECMNNFFVLPSPTTPTTGTKFLDRSTGAMPFRSPAYVESSALILNTCASKTVASTRHVVIFPSRNCCATLHSRGDQRPCAPGSFLFPLDYVPFTPAITDRWRQYWAFDRSHSHSGTFLKVPLIFTSNISFV